MAESMIKSARDAREREDFTLAWNEARRASRPLRTLMFGHWQNAFAELEQGRGEVASPSLPRAKLPIPVLMTPACCAPAIGFNTLPELYFWIDWIGGKTGYRFGANRLPTGSFDDPKGMADAGWVNMDYQMDGITAKMATVPREKSETNRMIRMVVEPTKKEDTRQERPVLRLPDRGHPLACHPGSGQEPDPDLGAGEAAHRQHWRDGGHHRPRLDRRRAASVPLAQPIPSFSRVVIYRKAPSDGTFTVTLGLAGYGEAFFDDLRVEFVEAGEAPEEVDTGDIAQEPPRRPIRQPANPDPSLPSTASDPSVPRTRRR